MLGDIPVPADMEVSRRRFDRPPRISHQDNQSVTGEGMDRRSFIRVGIFLPPVLAVALSSACSAPAPTAQSQPTPISDPPRPTSQAAEPPRPPVFGTGVPRVAPATGAPVDGATVAVSHPLPFLAELASITGSQVIAARIQEWLETRKPAQKDDVGKLLEDMAKHGFTDFRDPRVYSAGPAVFTGIGNSDGVNACTPFLIEGEKPALVEGPAMVGLALAARDWKDVGGVTAAQAFIPTGTISREQGSEFGMSYTSPFVYATVAGQVTLNYEAGLTGRRDRISVKVQRAGGDVLLRRDYRVTTG
jgi:hypothetical protein